MRRACTVLHQTVSLGLYKGGGHVLEGRAISNVSATAMSQQQCRQFHRSCKYCIKLWICFSTGSTRGYLGGGAPA